ncbi:MAG: helix-turn-helix domain-containing protein [Candidatus Aenigmatarchaeota archaeon]
MLEIIEELKRIGLTDGESRVYLALLEIGSSTVGPVVKKSGVAYSNIYEILQRLINKGLASFIIKNKTKYFQATNPAYLKEYLEKKEKEIKQNKKFLDSILPKIQEIQKIKSEQEAEIYIGIHGLRSAYSKAMQNEKGEWLWFYQEKEDYAKDVEKLYPAVLQLIKQSKISIKGIASESYRHSKLHKRLGRFQETRFVNFPIPVNMDMIGNTVLIESFRRPVTVISIKSETIAEDMRTYFYSVWKIAKK